MFEDYTKNANGDTFFWIFYKLSLHNISFFLAYYLDSQTFPRVIYSQWTIVKVLYFCTYK